MSKPLEQMTVKELRQYIFEHRNHNLEWEKAYDLFRQKAEWHRVPNDASPEEERQIIEELIAKRIQK